jgi:acetyl esterase/lipase
MPETPMLMDAGFIVASVNYRLSPEFKFPAHIEDVKCAIRYLRATAGKWNLDPNRIAAWGNSAGGHLAALAGLSNKADGWDVGQYLNKSSQVQAVVDMYGPTDLTDPAFASKAQRMLEILFGIKKPKLSVLRAASPFYQVTKAAPPFLIIHGNMDETVPWQQSRKLYNRLKFVGANPRFITVLYGGHGLTPIGEPETDPTRAQVAQSVVNFLLNRLK